jgi:uncharacterized protein YbjT (DUF2867 family)
MPETKTIVVFGATGAQGGSVVDALLETGSFKVRGVTRNTDSEKAQALAKKGVSLHKADMATGEGVEEAFTGAYGAFLLTNFWDPNTMNKEAEQGKALVDAAKKAGVVHVMFSALANVKDISKGKYDVPHFTDKAIVSEYAEKQGFKYYTRVEAAFYFQNWQYFFPPKENEDGVMVFTVPKSSSVTAYDVRDTGAYVAKAFMDPESFNNETLRYFGHHGDLQYFVDTFEKVTGKKSKLVQMDHDAYSKLFEGAHELAQMFGWFDEFNYYGSNITAEDLKDAPKFTSWEEFLRETGWSG